MCVQRIPLHVVVLVVAVGIVWLPVVLMGDGAKSVWRWVRRQAGSDGESGQEARVRLETGEVEKGEASEAREQQRA